MDLAPILAGAAIAMVSGLLTLITSHLLQRTLQTRQWKREDAVRRENQAREDVKPLIRIPDHGMIVPPGRLYCFPPLTRITLADGQTTPVEDVRPGDVLLSYDALKKQQTTTIVSNVVKASAAALIVLNDTLRTTSSHRIAQANGPPVPAVELTIGSKLVSQGGETVELVKIELLREECVVYNLETVDRHNFFANGFLTGDYFSKIAHEFSQISDEDDGRTTSAPLPADLAAKRREIKRRLMEGQKIRVSRSGEIT